VPGAEATITVEAPLDAELEAVLACLRAAASDAAPVVAGPDAA
jgi:hypothetical protein